MDERTFDTLVDRLRHSCLFYIKGDVLVLSAWVVLYATYHYEPPYSAITVSTFKTEFLCASLALFAGVLFESMLTTSEARADAALNARRARRLKRLYYGYIALQVLALSFVAGSIVTHLLAATRAALGA